MTPADRTRLRTLNDALRGPHRCDCSTHRAAKHQAWEALPDLLARDATLAALEGLRERIWRYLHDGFETEANDILRQVLAILATPAPSTETTET